jgi:class 3 adenylate cyclase
MALAPLLPAAGEQGGKRHTRAWQSGFRLVPRTANGARTAGTVMCYAVFIAGLLTTGRVTDGTPGLLIAAVLVVIATPVIGFTWNQVTLTEKGRQLAGSVAEIRSLKRTDSEAFSALIAARYGPAAIRRRLDDPGAESGQSCTYTCQGQGCGSSVCDSRSASIPHVPLRASLPSFWESLTDAERSWLLAAAHTVGFPAGAVLCRQARQVYDRLVEDRPVEPKFYLDGIATGQPAWSGLNCSIFLADIAAFGRHSRNDKDRQLLRASMYATLQHAFESSGVPWHSCYREDRGDGVLVIVPPSTPTRLLIDPLSDDIAMALAIHNDQATEALRMQLRVALHVGPVVSDPEGVSGESIILAARILEAPVLKRQLASEAADLGLIVSAYVYDTVVKHGPGRIDPARYRQVRVQLKESRLNAWICLSCSAKGLPSRRSG